MQGHSLCHTIDALLIDRAYLPYSEACSLHNLLQHQEDNQRRSVINKRLSVNNAGQLLICTDLQAPHNNCSSSSRTQYASYLEACCHTSDFVKPGWGIHVSYHLDITASLSMLRYTLRHPQAQAFLL